MDYWGACEIYWNLPVDGPLKLNGKVSMEVSVKVKGSPVEAIPPASRNYNTCNVEGYRARTR